MSRLRPALALASALGGALMTAACGFTPLYAVQAGGVSNKLASVSVEVPQTRTGYLLREELDDALARASGQPALYRLSLDIDEDRYPRGLRVDDVASRYELRLIVDYALTAAGAAAAPLTQGRTVVTVTYDSADPPYAGIAAATEGQERAASEAAQRIRLDLARWFALADRTPATP